MAVYGYGMGSNPVILTKFVNSKYCSYRLTAGHLIFNQRIGVQLPVGAPNLVAIGFVGGSLHQWFIIQEYNGGKAYRGALFTYNAGLIPDYLHHIVNIAIVAQ